MSKTKAFIDTYKGKKIFAVWNVDEHGNKEGRFPVVSFGAKKAEAIINNMDSLNKFADAYCNKPSEANNIVETSESIDDIL